MQTQKKKRVHHTSPSPELDLVALKISFVLNYFDERLQACIVVHVQEKNEEIVKYGITALTVHTYHLAST